MSDPKVSVIVPVYNTDRFLAKCLTSMAGQSYQNIEIIIVNDGSTDKSDKVITDFMRKEARAIYIKQHNQGVSAARNVGLKKAEGEYIFFCDSDDYNPRDAISTLVQVAERDKADVVVGNYLKRNRFGERLVKVRRADTAMGLIESFIVGDNHAGLSNKLYRKEALDGFLFNEKISIREDMLFNVQVLIRCPRISFVAGPVYVYVQRRGSAIKEISLKKMSDSNCVTALLEEILKGKASSQSLKKMLALNAYGNIVNYRAHLSKDQYRVLLKRLKMVRWGFKKKLIICMLLVESRSVSKIYDALRRVKQRVMMY